MNLTHSCQGSLYHCRVKGFSDVTVTWPRAGVTPRGRGHKACSVPAGVSRGPVGGVGGREGGRNDVERREEVMKREPKYQSWGRSGLG